MNKSVLPLQLTLLANGKFISYCDFSEMNILQVMRNPGSNKAHGHDMISIRMLQLCGDSICQSLEVIIKT